MTRLIKKSGVQKNKIEMSRPCFSDAITLPGQTETEPEVVETTENMEYSNRKGAFIDVATCKYFFIFLLIVLQPTLITYRTCTLNRETFALSILKRY